MVKGKGKGHTGGRGIAGWTGGERERGKGCQAG